MKRTNSHRAHRVPPIATEANTLLSATLFLIVSSCRTECPAVARMIADHLGMLAAHGQVAPTLRRLAATASVQWCDRHELPHQEAERLIASVRARLL